ncbi:MAG: hypothetical protein MUF80_09165 [Burkholderiales bacterium]|nr:hypothetical protein [Burkholderiales bacterium]
MARDRSSDPQSPQHEVLSKVDALLRRHRGGLDATPDESPDPEIPTLTELIEGSPAPAEVARSEGESPILAEEQEGARLPEHTGSELLNLLRPEIERVVTETLAARLPHAIQEQVMPEVMLQVGDALNRLRDAIRATVESVVRQTIEREVKRALKALLKERER